MDEKNSNLVHGFLFAVLVVILVYSGEQVRNIKEGNSCLFMKLATCASCFGIISVCASFLPAIKSRRHQKNAEIYLNKIKNLYNDKKNNNDMIRIKHVKKIEGFAMKYTEEAINQDKYNSKNNLLTNSSLLLLVISTILFGLGVFCL